MAVVIKAECPRCGVVRLGVGDLTVRVCTDDGSSTYTFRCVDCGGAVSHETTAAVRDLLVSSGVARQDWRWPAELTERSDSPRLTVDDLLDFHLKITRDDVWGAALAALRESVDDPTA